MEQYDDDTVGNSWPMKIFTLVLGGLILGYGVWCLYHGKAYTFGKLTPAHAYTGLAAYFIGFSYIALSAMFFTALYPFKNKRVFRGLASVLLVLFLVLGFVPIFL